MFLDKSRRDSRLLAIVLREVADEHIGVERNHLCRARVRIAASIASSVTGVAGAGTTPLRRRMSPEAALTRKASSAVCSKINVSPTSTRKAWRTSAGTVI